MDFSPPPSMDALLSRVRAFLAEVVLPLEPIALMHEFRAALPQLQAARTEAKARGLWAPQVPKEEGGLGLSLVELAFVGEALGASPLGHYCVNFQAPDAGNMELLHLFGTPAQKERWLRPLVDGAIRSCFSMTEPDRPGSNPVWLETTARRDGDTWVIDGRKWFTTAADGAALAIVMATTREDGRPHERASMLLVPMDTPGVVVERNIPVMGHAGSDWASHGEVRYTDVRVPLDALVGDEGHGFQLAQERLGPGRIHHCMRWLGICERAFSLLVERAGARAIAPFRPLAAQQVVQHWIAESRIEIDAARLMVLRAAWKIDTAGAKAARDDVAAIKVLCARTLQSVVDRAVQAHGALGVTDDTVLAWFYRHERAARIYDGPDEVHLTAIARRELKSRGIDLP